MKTKRPAGEADTRLPKISDLHTDATFLQALAEAADLLHYEASSNDKARNALTAVIDAIEAKAKTLIEGLELHMDRGAA